MMNKKLIWDENKRQANMQKHDLDFADADQVLESDYRLDIEIWRNNELRTASLPYVLGQLTILRLFIRRANRRRALLAFAQPVAKNGRP